MCCVVNTIGKGLVPEGLGLSAFMAFVGLDYCRSSNVDLLPTDVSGWC
jgi:hypothetical protein